MSVHQLKDGRHICAYKINGAPKREYFGRSLADKKKAEDFNSALKEQGIIHSYSRHKTIEQGTTFQELATAYLSEKAATAMPVSSVIAMEYKLGSVIFPALGHLKAAAFTHKRLDLYVKERLATPRMICTGPKKKPVYKTIKNNDGTIQYIKRTTVHRELSDIQSILNWAVTKQYIIANPVMGHKKPKKDNAILKPPSVRETQAILNQAAPHLIRAVRISFFTGLRPGEKELFRLTWQDVDWDAKTIFIVSAKKNGLPHRTVPLHPELFKDLIQWQKEDRDKPVRQIITWKNKPIKSVKGSYKSAKRRAGITRRIRLYDFRHAAVTNMLQDGADLKSVSQIAGHSRTDTTTRIYQHTNIELLRKSINTIPGLDEPAAAGGDNVLEFTKIKKNRHKTGVETKQKK